MWSSYSWIRQFGNSWTEGGGGVRKCVSQLLASFAQETAFKSRRSSIEAGIRSQQFWDRNAPWAMTMWPQHCTSVSWKSSLFTNLSKRRKRILVWHPIETQPWHPDSTQSVSCVRFSLKYSLLFSFFCPPPTNCCVGPALSTSLTSSSHWPINSENKVQGPDAFLRGVVCLCGWFEGDEPAGNIISLMTKCQINPTGFPSLLVWQMEGEQITAWLGISSLFFPSFCCFLLSFGEVGFIYTAQNYNKCYARCCLYRAGLRQNPFFSGEPTFPCEQALGISDEFRSKNFKHQ